MPQVTCALLIRMSKMDVTSNDAFRNNQNSKLALNLTVYSTSSNWRHLSKSIHVKYHNVVENATQVMIKCHTRCEF